jgi:plastocyanin
VDVKLRSLLAIAGFCLLAALPAQAGAFAASGAFTATDYHWGDASNGGATTVHIDPGGTVSFGYPSGGSTHDADFGGTPPTSCAPSLPTTPTAPGWSSTCTFDATGTYTFFCDLHASMKGTVLVGDVPDPPPAGGGTGGGGSGAGSGGGSGTQPPGTLSGIKLAKTQRSARVTGSVADVPAGASLTVTLTASGKRAGRSVKSGLAAGTAKFSVKPNRAALKKLKQAGKLKLGVTFALKTASATLTAKRSVTLKRR